MTLSDVQELYRWGFIESDIRMTLIRSLKIYHEASAEATRQFLEATTENPAVGSGDVPAFLKKQAD